MKRFLFVALLLFAWGGARAKPFEGTKFVVSGPSPHSPKIAETVFRQGGNIADMAVAVALGLTVTHPYYVSPACGGFAVIKIDSSVEALDFRETAPGKTGPDFFEKSGLSSREGGASVGTPGLIKGLVALHKKHGKLAWTKLVAPSLVLAQKGFPVSGDWVEKTQRAKKHFNPTGRELFFPNGRALKPNDIFRQDRWAKALKLIQKRKDKAVYNGPLGKDILSAIQASDGVMTEEDLKNYQIKWRKPLFIPFKGWSIYSMPLPSSGGLIIKRALKLIERKQLKKRPLYSLDEIHLLAEILSRAFRPRALMGDPDFTSPPEDLWLSETDLDEAEKSIDDKRVKQIPPIRESEETTHISLADAKGNAIAMTLTLNGSYGSHLVSPRYGIVLNNQMDDFSAVTGQANMFGLIQGRNNTVEPGKRPLSSMSPMIAVSQDEKALLVLGGAGGPKIISGVLQTLYRHIVHRMNVERAVTARRIHHQFLPRRLFMEDKSFNPDLVLNLKMRGHKIQFQDYIARVFAVSRDPEGRLFSARESRRESFAGGL